MFLGFSERSQVTEASGLSRLNLIGLSHFVPCLIFPAVVPGGSFVFALNRKGVGKPLNLELHSPTGIVTWTGMVATELLPPDESVRARASEHWRQETAQ